MDVTALGVNLAAMANVPLSEALAIGAVTARADTAQSGPDSARSLIDTLAYIGEVLSAEQDQLADEGFLETARADDEDLVHIRFRTELLPAVFVAVGNARAFVVVIGSHAGDATIRFGEGEAGRRPPTGLEDVTATYRHGEGHTGRLELRRLRLGRRWGVVAISQRATHAQGLICSLHR
jgi:hypothetical protein